MNSNKDTAKLFPTTAVMILLSPEPTIAIWFIRYCYITMDPATPEP